MAKFVKAPAVVQAAGNKPKRIEEYIGRINSGTAEVSIARMVSPGGWEEPGQTPQFDEYTLVLKGSLKVETKTGTLEMGPGEAVTVEKGEWVRYSTPKPEGAEYIAVCLPAFGPDLVHRDPT